MAQSPKKYKDVAPSNPYKGRWGWWYPAIADYMLANPGAKIADIAAHVNRVPQTISYIINTDMFRRYLDQRREEAQQVTDTRIAQKLTKIGELGLDLMYETMEKKRTSVPIGQLQTMTMSALDRLGYSPEPAKSPSVNVNVSGNNVAVGVEMLEEARKTLRRAEQNRALSPVEPPLQLELEAVPAAQASGGEEEV